MHFNKVKTRGSSTLVSFVGNGTWLCVRSIPHALGRRCAVMFGSSFTCIAVAFSFSIIFFFCLCLFGRKWGMGGWLSSTAMLLFPTLVSSLILSTVYQFDPHWGS